MRSSSLFILTGILQMLGLTFLSGPLMAQQVLPDGSIIIYPKKLPPADWCYEPAHTADMAYDDSYRIQQAINYARGTVYFKAGCYYLQHPLHLRSRLTYMGEGSWHPQYGSTLVQLAPADGLTGGVPIFEVDGVLESVTITGLAFGAPISQKGRAIAAVTPDQGLLSNSTILANHFHAELAECIDTPMTSTRIERNAFGTHGVGGPRHRHIHGADSSRFAPLMTGDNWIVSNVYRSACCETQSGTGRGSESVLFESRSQLHIVGNDFEAGQADTTLRIHGASQVFIDGNWFEQNHGLAQMTFSPAGSQARLENNYYVMQGNPPYTNTCNGQTSQGNCFIADFERDPNTAGLDLSLPATHLSIGYEAGGGFSAGTDLVPADLFKACHLTITGPFQFGGYAGTQTNGTSNCH